MNNRETKLFSGTLFAYACKSNLILMGIILLVFCLFTTVTNVAASLMSADQENVVTEEVQEDFYTYLGCLTAYDRLAEQNPSMEGGLSYEGFLTGDREDAYEQAFDLYNENKDAESPSLSVAGFRDVIGKIQASDVATDTYVDAFEYAYALQGDEGIFTGKELELSDMVETILATMGISVDDMERMQEVDFTSMLTRMYYTAMGVLIMFLFVIIASNSLVANQVDAGSMAYILSAPNQRNAVTFTQLLYMIVAPALIMAIGCLVRIVSTNLLFGEVVVSRILCLYLGMYLLVEAVAGICYMCSCIFNESKKSVGVGGGIAIWCFLASLLGLFGSQEMIDMGIGVESLGVFNKMTLVNLFDINAIQTIGTGAVDLSFVPKLIALLVVALLTYMVGIVRFSHKDLPL